MKLIAKVTQEHIDKGKIGDCESCPIARAVFTAAVDSHPSSEVVVSVPHAQHDDSIGLEIDGTLYLAPLSLDADEFIDNFDNRRPVLPFTLDLIFDSLRAVLGEG